MTRAAQLAKGLDSFIIICSDETTAITAGTSKMTVMMPYDLYLTEVQAYLTTAQVSGNIFTIDINKNGSSIFFVNRLTIDNTEKSSLTATTPPTFSALALIKGDEISVDVDQIGNSTAKGLKIILIGAR